MYSKKIIRIFITFIIGIAVFLSSPSATSAQDTADSQSSSPIQDTFSVGEILTPPGATPRTPPEENASLISSPILLFIADTVDFLIAIVGSFSLLVFIIGAIYMLISEGQEDRLQKGKQAMTFSLIGLAIALMAYVITTVVQSIFF